MAIVQKKDFIELDYTGKLKEDNTIFDTTDEKLAKDNNLIDEKAKVGPAKICIGEDMVLAGIEKALIGKEIGAKFTIELKPENAFGKKDARLIKTIPITSFQSQDIDPQPGLQINVDGIFGIVKRVGGGRILVDFNHPLAGKELVYEVKINKKIDDIKEKIDIILSNFNIKSENITVENDKAIIEVKEKISIDIEKKIRVKILGLASVKEISFKEINLNISK